MGTQNYLHIEFYQMFSIHNWLTVFLLNEIGLFLESIQSMVNKLKNLGFFLFFFPFSPPSLYSGLQAKLCLLMCVQEVLTEQLLSRLERTRSIKLHSIQLAHSSMQLLETQ